MNQSLVALYELKRQSFLIGFIENPTRFSSALAFAYHKRLAPIFHQAIERETYDSDPFDEIYAVSSGFVMSLMEFIDAKWSAKDLEPIAFYNLEMKFGNRIGLIHALEYGRIAGRFDESVWEAVESNAPIEAKPLKSTFQPTDVYFS